MRILIGLSFGLGLFPLTAETGKSPSEDRTIVIQEHTGKIQAPPPEVFVESGSFTIEGEPFESFKRARRSWEEKCESWKKEMKQLNGTNLIFISCGKSNRAEEKIQSEKYYTYQSTGSYKIKVLGK